MEVLSFDGETLELQCDQPLAPGPLRVIALNAELELELECDLHIDQGFPEKKLFWASCPPESELPARLTSLIPREAEAAQQGENSPPSYEEKRKKLRLQRVIGVMSPHVEGFRCITHDFHSDGMRLQLQKPLTEGANLKLRFELEDHRMPPFDVQARVQWCQENPYKGGFWAGLEFTNISSEQQAMIDKFVAEVQSYEEGVLTRDYVGD